MTDLLSKLFKALQELRLAVLGASTRRPPFTFHQGNLYVVDGPLQTFTTQITLSGTSGSYSAVVNQGADILVHAIIGRVIGTSGSTLDDCRFAVRDSSGNSLYVVNPDARSNGTPTDPVASSVLLSSRDHEDSRQALGLVIPKGEDRQYTVTAVTTTAGDVVELTTLFQRIRPV